LAGAFDDERVAVAVLPEQPFKPSGHELAAKVWPAIGRYIRPVFELPSDAGVPSAAADAAIAGIVVTQDVYSDN
jgi:hypothetical protein